MIWASSASADSAAGASGFDEVTVTLPPAFSTASIAALEAPVTLQSRSTPHFGVVPAEVHDTDSGQLPPPLPPLLGTYPINPTYGNRPALDNHLPPPPSLQPPSLPAKPVTSRVPRFTEYLQNESLQLRQRGHVYRVSKQGRDAAVAAATSQAPATTGTVRKTVRFSSDAKAASPDTSYEQLDVSTLPDIHPPSVPVLPTHNTYTNYASIHSSAGMPLSSLPNTGSLRMKRPPVHEAGVILRGASAAELDSLV